MPENIFEKALGFVTGATKTAGEIAQSDVAKELSQTAASKGGWFLEGTVIGLFGVAGFIAGSVVGLGPAGAVVTALTARELQMRRRGDKRPITQKAAGTATLLAGAGMGAAIGSVFGPIGTMVGLGVGIASSRSLEITVTNFTARVAKFFGLSAGSRNRLQKRVDNSSSILNVLKAQPGAVSVPFAIILFIMLAPAFLFVSFLLPAFLYTQNPKSGSGGLQAGVCTPTLSPFGPTPYQMSQGYSTSHPGVDLITGGPFVIHSTFNCPVNVVYAGPDPLISFGNFVALQSGPMFTFSAHLASYSVRAGQVVSPGGQIGMMGSTGNSTGPHLHYEIRQGSVISWLNWQPALTLNPCLWGISGSFC